MKRGLLCYQFYQSLWAAAGSALGDYFGGKRVLPVTLSVQPLAVDSEVVEGLQYRLHEARWWSFPRFLGRFLLPFSDGGSTGEDFSRLQIAPDSFSKSLPLR